MPFMFVYQLPFRVAELLVAMCVVFIVAGRSAADPDSTLALLIRLRWRVWLALGLFLLSLFLPRSFVGLMLLRTVLPIGAFEMEWITDLLRNLMNGVALGLVGCLLAAPENPGEKLDTKRAAVIAATIIGLMAFGQLFIRPARMAFGPPSNLTGFNLIAVLVFLMFMATRAGNNDSTDTSASSATGKNPPALPWVLGIAPSALLLLVLPQILLLPGLLLFACLTFSVGCCATSSILLFRRRTRLSILGAIFFLLSNGAISLFFGYQLLVTLSLN